MDKSGRVVLTGPIRKALHLKGPAAFRAEVMGNKVELTLLPASNRTLMIKKRKGLLVVATGGRKFDAAEAVRIIQDERS